MIRLPKEKQQFFPDVMKMFLALTGKPFATPWEWVIVSRPVPGKAPDISVNGIPIPSLFEAIFDGKQDLPLQLP